MRINIVDAECLPQLIKLITILLNRVINNVNLARKLLCKFQKLLDFPSFRSFILSIFKLPIYHSYSLVNNYSTLQLSDLATSRL